MRQERISSQQQQQPRKTKSGAPALFLCPISLEIMKDPVIVCTGQTYDRPSIEKWIRDGHRSCPITMLHLHDLTLIPNIIVRQLIEAWSASEDAAAAMFGPPIEPAATSSGDEAADCLLWSGAEEAGRSGGGSGAAVDREQVLGLLRSIARGQNVRDSVSSLRAMAKNEIKHSSSNVCTCIVEAGGALLLASMLAASSDRQEQHEDDDACDEVLALLGLLCRGSSRDVVGAVLAEAGALESVVGYLSSSSIANSMRMNSAMLLKRLLVTEELRATVGKAPGFFRGLLDLISSSNSSGNNVSDGSGKKSLVKVLQLACSYKPNRSKAVEQGAIGVLVGLLAATSSSHDGRALAAAERALATIELLCTVEQGRRSACGHPAAVATVVRMLLGFSRLCTEHATGCLLLVSQSGPVEVLQVAMRAGARRQLLLLLQSDCTGRAKRKALEMLKLFHAIFFEGDPGMAVSSDFKNVDLY